MEKRIKQRVTDYIGNLKKEFQEYITQLDINDSVKHQLYNYIHDYTTLELTKDDFVRRKRVKNVVPLYDRCRAKRANGEQCTRRKKEGETYCGTHTKGQPHGVITENETHVSVKKIVVKAQDIRGIIYYVDEDKNVYDPYDIMNGVKNPRILGLLDDIASGNGEG